MATIYAFRTSTYARNIYIYGVTTFSAIDQTYVTEVKKYAALNYSGDTIKNALDKGWITLQEYNDTIALIPA